MLYPLSYERGCLASLRHSEHAWCKLPRHGATASTGTGSGRQLPKGIADFRCGGLTGSIGTLAGSADGLAGFVVGALA
jgi:hypothetical protein